MDRQLIKSLIDAFEASELTELEYSRGGTTLRLVERRHGSARCLASGTTHGHNRATRGTPGAASTPALNLVPLNLVLAPLYGVVHLQRTPGAAPFVAPGQVVEAGQVLCTIEAMKVFTDVLAERPGTVAEILAVNAQEVEAGQPLIRLA